MQTYSTVKGRSNSDDGNLQLLEHTVLERQTISDDGFDSFPAYTRPAVKEYRAEDDGESENEDKDVDVDASFYSCDSELQSYRDAESHHSDPEAEGPAPLGRSTSTSAPQKKKQKRRRPKKKNKSSLGEGSTVEKIIGSGQDSSAGNKRGSGKGKGAAREEEARKMSPRELVDAMELLQLWNGRSGGRK